MFKDFNDLYRYVLENYPEVTDQGLIRLTGICYVTNADNARLSTCET